jgi:dsRNA-specific ribonuclease
MRRLRIPKLGSQFLASRPSRISPCPYPLHKNRPNSTQASQFSSSPFPYQNFSSDAPPPSSKPPSIPLEDLPSPPVSASLKSPKLAALHARLLLPRRFPLQTLARTLVDPTADPNDHFNNSALATLGSDILGYYMAEHLICHYPRIPMDVLFAAQEAYVGPRALASMTREWGVEYAAEPGGEVDAGLLQFRQVQPGQDPNTAEDGQTDLTATGRKDRVGYRRGISSRVVYDDQFGDLKKPELGSDNRLPITTVNDASTGFVRALMGALYLHTGRLATKKFFTSHFLSRTLNLSQLFDFRYPTRDLSRLCLREGFEAPVACLDSETGRDSAHPVFVVGVYSGRDKLGEGAGGSLDEARNRAATAALKGWYLYSPVQVVVPSEVEAGDPGGKWKSNMVDPGEIIT